MTWTVTFCDEFALEYEALNHAVQDELLAQLIVLEQFGPSLGRPQVDTLKDSKHANMKELRFSADHGVWRVAFAFDPKRAAIALVAGDKSGTSQRRFYEHLIRNANKRLDRHLASPKEGNNVQDT
ncbi:MAG: type II toxin-antitoxin system RelE/ParE family toxin [Haliea sp.]|nr:type II toxin-antitoxin system RelE/ParE family toxin [Haliea sp.]